MSALLLCGSAWVWSTLSGVKQGSCCLYLCPVPLHRRLCLNLQSNTKVIRPCIRSTQGSCGSFLLYKTTVHSLMNRIELNLFSCKERSVYMVIQISLECLYVATIIIWRAKKDAYLSQLSFELESPHSTYASKNLLHYRNCSTSLPLE